MILQSWVLVEAFFSFLSISMATMTSYYLSELDNLVSTTTPCIVIIWPLQATMKQCTKNCTAESHLVESSRVQCNQITFCGACDNLMSMQRWWYTTIINANAQKARSIPTATVTLAELNQMPPIGFRIGNMLQPAVTTNPNQRALDHPRLSTDGYKNAEMVGYRESIYKKHLSKALQVLS